MPIADINNHKMYYETIGEGDPVMVMGGWGTYCHGGEKALPRGMTDEYQAVIIDYRGIGESDDDTSQEPSIEQYADDAIELLEHLGHTGGAHIVGLVGMGACIAQVMAVKRPDMVRSMINMGAWSEATDTFFRHQIEMFEEVHRLAGWEAFQKLVCVMSFKPEFWNANWERLLGPQGPWNELNGRLEAHQRFIKSCLAHNYTEELAKVKAPSLVIHSHLDIVTSPRMTQQIQDAIPNAEGHDLLNVAHVVAGKEEKIIFTDLVMDWLHRN